MPTEEQPSESKQYKLQFEGKLPHKLFTMNKIVAEGPSPVKILLLDAASGQTIKDGPLSSKKVEIVALHGHFEAEQLEEWTKEDFCGHMLRGRDNKRPLLVGKCVITLRNGIGFVNDVCFTDNSSWVRSGMFRLGAKLVGEQDQVMEVVSSPFRVKDRRGETYQKHNIPSPEDEVWRLRGIAKNGKIHKRLKEHKIENVKDLVTQYHFDQSLLRRILKVTTNKWNEIIQQATCCSPGNYSCTNLTANVTQCHIPNDKLVLESQTNVGEHNHQLDQPMPLDDNVPSLDELLARMYNSVHSPSTDYYMPSSPFSTTFNFQTSSWLPNQSMRGKDTTENTVNGLNP